jgi:DNA-directed RNA polymerase specialized sigma24 family protein
VTISDERTDRQLWADAAQRDGDAFGTLFRQHARAVYNHCFRLTGSWTVADAAEALGLAESSVRARVSRARAKVNAQFSASTIPATAEEER